MKKLVLIVLSGIVLTLSGCTAPKSTAAKSSQDGPSEEVSLKENLREKNRTSISLLTRIRQLPGIAMRNGVPVFTKNTSSIAPGEHYEPLYVLNDYAVGNSFSALNEIVEPVYVKDIEVLSDSEASFYGSRAANGVIKITTF